LVCIWKVLYLKCKNNYIGRRQQSMSIPNILQGRNTLIVIAGGQITPNMYTIRTLSPTRLIIFRTTHPDSQSAARRMLDYAKKIGCSCSILTLSDGLNAAKVKEDLKEELNQLNIDFKTIVFQATSGTKPMTIGVLDFVRSYCNSNIPVLYYEKRFV